MLIVIKVRALDISINETIRDDEDFINFQTRFERNEAKNSLKNLSFADNISISSMQFINFVSSSAIAWINDDKISFDMFSFNNSNADTNADNHTSSSSSSNTNFNAQSIESSDSVSSSINLQIPEKMSSSQQENIDIPVLKLVSVWKQPESEWKLDMTDASRLRSFNLTRKKQKWLPI